MLTAASFILSGCASAELTGTSGFLIGGERGRPRFHGISSPAALINQFGLSEQYVYIATKGGLGAVRLPDDSKHETFVTGIDVPAKLLFCIDPKVNFISIAVNQNNLYSIKEEVDPATMKTVSGKYIFEIYSLADPENPVKQSSLSIDFKVYKISPNGNFVYLINRDSLIVVDVKNIEKPEIVKSLKLWKGENEIWNEPGFLISGKYAYATNKSLDDKSLKVLDISNPKDAKLVIETDIEGVGSNFTKKDNYLFIATTSSFNHGWRIVDISNPEIPKLVVSKALDSIMWNALAVVIDGNTAFISMKKGFSVGDIYIYNIADPLNPQEIGKYFSTAFGSMLQSNPDGLVQNETFICFNTGHSIYLINKKDIIKK